MRLKGQGVKQADGSAGDLIVELQIKLPDKIDEESEKLIEGCQYCLFWLKVLLAQENGI